MDCSGTTTAPSWTRWRRAKDAPRLRAAERALSISESTPHRRAPLRRALYVVSQFPCLSETFIVREINTLIAQGVDVRILSLKPPSRDPLQRDSAALLDRVLHPHPPRTLRNAAQVIATHPDQVLGALAAIVADGWRRPLKLIKSLGAVLRGLEHVARLKSLDPQLIHAHWASYPTTVAWVLSRVLDRPFGFTCHAHDIFVESQLLTRKIHEAALAVTISHFNVDWLCSHATPAAALKLWVVHCGVDL
jgi:hypothetical protein